LLAAGHNDARRYPLARLTLEYDLVVKREAVALHNQASLYRLAAAAAQPGAEEANKAFNKAMQELVP